MVTFLGLERPPSSRPILVLTHKEAAFLEWGAVKAKERWQPESQLRRGISRRVFNRLSLHYSFGVHIGGRVGLDHPAYSPRFSFILGNPLMQPPDDQRFIPLPSAYFSLGQPSVLSELREWDIAAVGTSARYKRWPEFLDATVELLGLRPTLRVLAVMLPADRSQQIDNLRLFHQRVPSKFRGQFTFINMLPLWPEKGLPNDLLRSLLARSKVFALFSEMEGTSKVLVEALGNGCRCVVNEVIRHRAGQALPPTSSETFDPIQFTAGYERQALEVAIDSFTPTRARASAKANRQRFSFERALESFRDSYASITGHDVEVFNEEDLHLRLDSHVRSPLQPTKLDSPPSGTSDMLSIRAWRTFEQTPADKIRQLCSPRIPSE